MKVLLVNPPRPTPFPSFPVGLAYLAALLREHNVLVSCIDAEAERMDFSTLKKEIAKRKPDIVGVTASTPIYHQALKVAEAVKEVNLDIKMVIGGTHVSVMSEETLRESPHIDFVVHGEGEYAFLELIRALERNDDLSRVRGITYRIGKKTVGTSAMPFIQNLDELPLPAWDCFRMDLYPDIKVVSGRGCPYDCTFCITSQTFGKTPRMRNPKKIVDELELIVEKYPSKKVTFWEPNFTYDLQRARMICREILKRNIQVRWDCVTRVDLVNKKILETLRKAGCESMFFGVESGEQVLLNKMRKGTTIAQIRRAFKWTKEAGINAIASFILGYPGETRETIKRTANFAKELEPTSVIFSLAVPYPGTDFFLMAKRKKLINTFDWSKYTRMVPLIETESLTSADLREALVQAYLEFGINLS